MARKKRIYYNLAVLAFIAAFLIILCRFWDIYYAVNDDIATRNVLSGSYTGSPRAQSTSCILSLYPITFCISGLYRLIPNVDVWGFFLMASHLICFLLIMNTVMGKVKTGGHVIKVCIAVSIFFWTFDIVNLIFFQFTTVAAIYAATSVFLLLMESNTLISYIPSICMLAISFCIRKDTTIMVLPFVGLAWLYKVCADRNEIKKAVKQGICYFVITGLLCSGLLAIDIYANRASYFNKYYQEYEALRIDAWDYRAIPDYDTNPVFYQSFRNGEGLSKEEYSLISQANMAMDFSVDVKEVLHYMVQYSKAVDHYVALKYKIQAARNLFMTVFVRDLIKPLVVSTGIMLILISAYLIYARKALKLLFLLTGEAGIVMEACILLYRGRMPERVWQCLILIAVVWMFGILAVGEGEAAGKECITDRINRRSVFLLELFCLSVFCVCLIPAINITQKRYEKSYHRSKIVDEYCMEHSENIYCFPYSFFTTVDKLGNKGWYSDQFKNYVHIGWGAFNPAYYEMLNHAGIDGTVEEAVVMQDNVYMMGTYADNSLPLFDSYFMWKYGEDYSYEVVDVLEEEIYVWKVHLQKNR